MNTLRPVSALAIVTATLFLAACASPRPQASSDPPPRAVEYEVWGMLHIKDQQANICAGVLQSYPPQCAGAVPVAGHDTFAAPPNLHESSHGMTWGDVLLIGTYEDGTLTLTHRPLPRPAPNTLAPESVPTDPAGEPPNPDELRRITEDIAFRNDPRVFSVGPGPDAVEVLTPLDEGGELQASFDAEFGPGVVVWSWLQPRDGAIEGGPLQPNQ